MSIQHALTDLAAKAMNAGHRAILKVSGGRVLGTAFGIGFIIAGAFSYVMSRRLGLLEPTVPPARDVERGDFPVA